ncbi:DUF2771 domain-containing protein [Embleya sp. NBC_00896]|uniref:DUF2771 domain-containing protein n=1 Tax=Embleya sp. NBC_00896 TaxID=2975961 RepID=UPI00386A435A|nr:DUF2771 domain-containing protein [Embleya sp. NBC_00896]
MKTRRPAALAGAAVLGALALTACSVDKPTPLVTLVAGSTSVHSEADCYDTKGLDEARIEKCLADSKPKTIKVPEGNSFSIGVDNDIADTGWQVLVNGKEQTEATMKTTYYSGLRLSYGEPAEGSKPLPVQIIERKGEKIRGVWTFLVEKK